MAHIFNRLHSLTRFGVGKLCHNALQISSNRSPISSVRFIQPIAGLSTSKKNSDTTTTANPSSEVEQSDVDPTNVSGKKKHWQTFGYDWYDQEEDTNIKNLIMFGSITVITVGLGFIMAYMPDVKLKDWSQREAYIELARREALGLPHVDPNLIPPEKVNLPSEEELEDFEIVI